ncbi:hypothetical protein [Streptomyces griseosporeus]
MNRIAQAPPSTTPQPRTLASFPAGHPRGSKPAEEYAAAQRAAGTPATVVMDLSTDTFVVKAVA